MDSLDRLLNLIYLDEKYLLMVLVCLGVGVTTYGIIQVLWLLIKKKYSLGNRLTVDRKTVKNRSIDSFSNWIKRLEKRSPSNNFNLKPITLLLAIILLGFGIFIFKNPIPAALMALLLIIIPDQLIVRRNQLRNEKIQEQLARAIRIFASEYTITPQIERGLLAVARTVENPVGGIFQRAYNCLTYRHDFETVLSDMAISLNTPHGHIFVQLLRASRKHGKAISPLFYELVTKITVAQELLKKNKGEVSGERILSMIMAFSPLPIYLLLSNWTSETQVFLTQTVAGRFVVVASFASAIIWMFIDRLMGGQRI